MENEIDLLEVLEYIDPTMLSYQEWVNVGMGLKYSGYTAMDWDNWSKRDNSRYHSGECYRKWGTFQGNSNPITAGTIVQMAKEHGWHAEYQYDDCLLYTSVRYLAFPETWLEDWQSPIT